MTKFKLGEMVRGGPRLRRHTEQTGKRVWEVHEWMKKPVEGIYSGCRTYRNGFPVYDDGLMVGFDNVSTIKVALIIPDTRTNPIPVLFDSLERVDSKTFTIKPLEWEEIETDYETALTENCTYEVFDNEKFPPTSHNGGRYLTPPAKGFGATGDNMESSFHDTLEQAKAACQADWKERICAALVEVES